MGRARAGKRWQIFVLALTALTLVVVSTVSWLGQRGPSPASDTAGLAPLDPAQVQRGRQVYVQYCASCHGLDAKGASNWQQPDARGNLPAPPHDDSGHTWRHSDAQLAAIIRHGMRDPFNKTPELTMPAFGHVLSDEQIEAVITYFKSLWSREHRQSQEEQNQRPDPPSGM
ncbi:MAG TPA: cytochrome c [Chloroflexota bacterium]|nr:cytochrome c [Chloroflexota bacterium]